MKVAIYALLNEAGEVVYVGASVSPELRLKYHVGGYGQFTGEKLTIQVLRWCPPYFAAQLELELIAEYLRLGHPLRNVRTSTGWMPKGKASKPKKEKAWPGNSMPRMAPIVPLCQSKRLKSYLNR